MTLHLIDLASYQEGIDLDVVRRAGYQAVNIKTSEGYGYVWERAPYYAEQARARGMGISTFHWLDSSASGAEQARIAYGHMQRLGGPDGMAHQCDCEDDATYAIWRDYVNAMQDKLGRHVINYTGDWWWQQRGWSGADLTPYLWAAPNVGYLGGYPGDGSNHWRAGYGGWDDYAALQYAVAPIPGAGGGNISLTAIRDPAVWAALTGEDTTDMGAIDDVKQMLTELYPFIRGTTSGRVPGGPDAGKRLTDTYDGAVLPGTRQLGEQGDAILAAVKAGAAADATRDASTLAALNALGSVIAAGGGNVDTAAIKAFIDAAAAASRTQMETLHTENTGLKAQVTGLEAKVADLTTKLAAGAQAEADALKP